MARHRHDFVCLCVPVLVAGLRYRRSITLQNQLDGLFASLNHYRRGKEGLSQKRSHFRRRGVRVGVGNRVGFKIVIVGDSTMRVSGSSSSSLVRRASCNVGPCYSFDRVAS